MEEGGCGMAAVTWEVGCVVAEESVAGVAGGSAAGVVGASAPGVVGASARGVARESAVGVGLEAMVLGRGTMGWEAEASRLVVACLPVGGSPLTAGGWSLAGVGPAWAGGGDALETGRGCCWRR